jgi:hypothetical protein
MADNEDELFDDNTDEDTGDTDSSANADADGHDSDDDSAGDSKDNKRINDLMSKWQSSEAEVKRLKTELARRDGTQDPEKRGDGDRKKSGSSVADEFLEYSRQMVRSQLYESDPRLKAYGIEQDAIVGNTPAEMRESFKAQLKLIERIETRARNAALIDHGISPEIVGSSGDSKPVDFDKMSSEDFAKYYENVKRSM